MRNRWLVCLLLGGLAYGQAASPTPAPVPNAPAGVKVDAGTADKPAEAKVNPGDPVITIKSPCDDPAKKGETCETIVTREQFERLADSLQPGMAAPIKLRLASAYSKLAAMSKEAEKRGLDKQTKFEENMRFARMQILSQQLTGSLQQEANNVSDSDIEKYYNEKLDTYQEASLQRLFIPKMKQYPAPPKTTAKKSPAAEKQEAEARQKAGETAMQKAATTLQARAAKGENFDALEKEAYLLAGLKGNPPSTKMEKVRPNILPPAHQSVLQLKTGGVSPVITDTSGYYIYKLVSKQTLPMDTVKQEIKNWIATQRFRDAMQQFQGSAQLNEAYFGSQPKPKPQPAKPGSEPAEQDVDPD